MVAIDPNEAVLVVVDMQNAFCHPDGSLYAPGSEAAVEPVVSLITQVREHDVDVIFTRDTHSPEQFDGNHYYDEFERWGEHVLEGSWDAELHGDLPVGESDYVVEKYTYDAFYRTGLEAYLDNHGITDLLITGTLANVCVLHTAGSAGLRDYRPLLVEEAIGCLEPDHKEYALEHADWLFGEVVTAEDVTFDD